MACEKGKLNGWQSTWFLGWKIDWNCSTFTCWFCGNEFWIETSYVLYFDRHQKCIWFSLTHPAILATIIQGGCPNYLVKLVSSFLSNRRVTLSHNGSKVESDVNLGCPQGGVLSPFLWVILIDDLLRLNFPFPFRIIAYADDLTVMTSLKDALLATKNLQSMCDAIAVWCINWLPHVTAKCLAAKWAFFAARKSLRAIWGINRTTLLFTYTLPQWSQFSCTAALCGPIL